jgi:hypothetical protein
MRLHVSLAALSAVSALAAFAPAASAVDPVCVATGGDGKNPLRSSACVVVTEGTQSYTITTGCSLLGDKLQCAIKPIVLDFNPTP